MTKMSNGSKYFGLNLHYLTGITHRKERYERTSDFPSSRRCVRRNIFSEYLLQFEKLLSKQQNVFNL
jgi:hypothetical protein